MNTACKLAGYFVSQAMWSVSGGELLRPMLAYRTLDGEKKMERIIIDDDLALCVAYGRTALNANEVAATDAALIYEDRIVIGDVDYNAVIAELRAYASPQADVVIAVPYTLTIIGQFFVHKPKILSWSNCKNLSMGDALRAFFTGIGSHESGGRIWNECFDESV